MCEKFILCQLTIIIQVCEIEYLLSSIIFRKDIDPFIFSQNHVPCFIEQGQKHHWLKKFNFVVIKDCISIMRSFKQPVHFTDFILFLFRGAVTSFHDVIFELFVCDEGVRRFVHFEETGDSMLKQIFFKAKPDSHANSKIFRGNLSILGAHIKPLFISFEHFRETFKSFKSSLLLNKIFINHFGELFLRELVISVFIPLKGFKNRENSLEFVPSILYLIFQTLSFHFIREDLIRFQDEVSIFVHLQKSICDVPPDLALDTEEEQGHQKHVSIHLKQSIYNLSIQ